MESIEVSSTQKGRFFLCIRKKGRYANNLPLFFAVLKSFTIFAEQRELTGTIMLDKTKTILCQQ